MSKVFDTVDHGLRINEVKSLEFGDPLLSWLRSYLSNRKQFIKIRDVYSDPINVTSGVPQGGNLSLLLFNMFVNYIFNHVSRDQILLYANDITIFHKIKALEGCSLQDKLNKFFNWVARLWLSLNLIKLHVIIFSRSRTPIHNNYHISGTLLQRVYSIIDLGIHYSSTLCFCHHI